jgi:hypothetical protein
MIATQFNKVASGFQTAKATTASRKSTVIRAGAYDAELIQTAVRHIGLSQCFIVLWRADRTFYRPVVDARHGCFHVLSCPLPPSWPRSSLHDSASGFQELPFVGGEQRELARGGPGDGCLLPQVFVDLG